MMAYKGIEIIPMRGGKFYIVLFKEHDAGFISLKEAVLAIKAYMA